MATYVLTLVGDDRSGLVDALSGVIAKHSGNWTQSHMSRLAGKFAGVVLVSIPSSAADEFIVDVGSLQATERLEITVESADPSQPAAGSKTVSLDMVGTDRPGIIHDVSHELAKRGVGILELETRTSEAPMAGGTLFHASAKLALPEGVSADDLIDGLEQLAGELMVDIGLTEDTGY